MRRRPGFSFPAPYLFISVAPINPACTASAPRRPVRVCPVIALILFMTVSLLFLAPCVTHADGKAPVSCDVMSQDIKLVIKDLAGQAKVNVIIDDTLQRRITTRLDGIPFEDALKLLAASLGFEIRQEGPVFLILSPSTEGLSHITPSPKGVPPPAEPPSSQIFEIGSLDQQMVVEILKAIGSELTVDPFPEAGVVVVSGPYSQVNSARNALQPWLTKLSSTYSGQVVRIARLQHIDAQEAASSLSGQFPGVRASVLRSSNSLVVSGLPQDVEKVLEAVSALDRAPKIVRIEVEIVEIAQDAGSNLGINWRGQLGHSGASLSWKEIDLPMSPGQGGEAGGSGVLPGILDLRPWIRSSLSLWSDINLLVEQGKAKVLARPSITTLENKPARIMTGDRYTVVLTQSSGQSTWQQFQYIDTGVRLEITPRVDDGGNIIVTLYPQVSDIVGFTKEGYPRLATREAQTTVRVKDGETLAIGGLIQQREVERTSGVPLLGDLPVVGRLFSAKKTSDETTELVILVRLEVVE